MHHQFITGILTATLMLTGCSGNPLQKKPADEAARLLSNASSEAMESIGVHERGISDQYAQCMEKCTKSTFDCATLYQAMAKKLTEQGISVSAAQIQDRKLYARIKEELQQRSYFSF
jgi:uncharacterized lipoprotein YajG